MVDWSFPCLSNYTLLQCTQPALTVSFILILLNNNYFSSVPIFHKSHCNVTLHGHCNSFQFAYCFIKLNWNFSNEFALYSVYSQRQAICLLFKGSNDEVLTRRVMCNEIIVIFIDADIKFGKLLTLFSENLNAGITLV